MLSNSDGDYATTPAATMTAFDRLPPTARRALRDAAFCWAPQPLLKNWRRGRKGYKTGRDLAERVAFLDRGNHNLDARRGVVAFVPGSFYVQPLDHNSNQREDVNATRDC